MIRVQFPAGCGARSSLFKKLRRKRLEVMRAVVLPVLFVYFLPAGRAIAACSEQGEQADGRASAQIHLGRGYDHIEKEQYQPAADEFKAALALDPRLIRARYQLAVCNFALGRRTEARSEFERVQSELPGQSSVVYYLGRLDLLDHSFDRAVQRLRSVAADPPFPDTAYYLGSAYLQKGDLQLAETWLKRGAKLDPNDFRVPDHLARVYQKLGRRHGAEREYARSADLRRRYDETARQAVECSRALETQSLDSSIAVCQVLSASEDADKLTTLGMLYGNHGHFAEALEPLRRAAALDPDSSEVQHDLGLTYFRLKRYSEARAPLERAVELRPDFFGSNALLGAVLFVLKEDQAAFRVLDHAHGLNPRDADTVQLLFKTALSLGRTRMIGKRYEEGLSYLRKAVELEPTEAAPHLALAQTFQALGRPAEAEQERESAEHLASPNR
jgi:tetratricopeptide (TPR) repeat protein